MNTAQKRDRLKSIDASEKERACWKHRLAIAVPLALLLMGPTPGAVGSCNQDKDDNRVLSIRDDMIDYCQQKEQLICYRRHLRDELDADEYTDCRHEVIRLCETRYWSPDCRPTERQAEACLRALSSMDTLDIEESEIKECSQDALCNVDYEDSEPSDLDAGE
jgi:hypothetical protein